MVTVGSNDHGGYTWRQAGDEIDIDFPVQESISTKQVKCKFESRRMSLVVDGKKLFSSELCGIIDVDESSWSLEGTGEKRKVVVNIAKGANKEWPALSLEEAKSQKQDFEVH